MIVYDMTEESSIETVEELRAFLARRHGNDVNEFWLSKTAGAFPRAAMLVNSDRAFFCFIPEDGHAGFVPDGYDLATPADEQTIFYVNTPTEEIPVLNTQVLPLEAALQAAEHFFVHGDKTPDIRWFEL